MDGPKMADSAKILLRLLPVEILNRVLAALDPKDADRLRAMRAEANAPIAPDEQSRALGAFFDLTRIASRAVPQADQSSPESMPSQAATPAVTVDENAADPIR